MFRHEGRNRIPNQGVEVCSLLNDLEIVKIRKGLDSCGLMWGEHSATFRVGEPAPSVATESSRECRCWFVPSHSTIDCRIGVVALLAWRSVLVWKIVFVLSNEPIHSLLVDGTCVRGLVEY